MNRHEANQLLAERSALERMIADTPADEVIDLRSLQARLDAVNRELEMQPQDTREPVKARLTFRGRPVVGSHGIFAEFGVTATKAFTDAIALLAASFETDLAATGPIPNRTQNQLLITSTAVGSFGFELEEHREDFLPPEEESALAQALNKAQELLHGAACGSDDELTEAASGQDPRAVAALRDFLKKLADNEAVCAVTVGEKAFSFSDVGEVQRSLTRLGKENLHEQPKSFSGAFQGALPKRRTFEFRVAGTGEVIAGKIGSTITEPGLINRHLEQPVDICLVETRVGQGRPRYVLNELPRWP
jgi:hypothetical protein